MVHIQPEIRRYSYRLAATMALYVVILIAVNLWFRRAPPHGLLAYVAAVLPAFPIAGIFVVIGRLIVELRDEYIRMQFVRHLLVATAITLSLTTAWGFLEGFGLAPHVAGYYAATIWFSTFGIIAWVAAIAAWRSCRAAR